MERLQNILFIGGIVLLSSCLIEPPNESTSTLNEQISLDNEINRLSYNQAIKDSFIARQQLAEILTKAGDDSTIVDSNTVVDFEYMDAFIVVVDTGLDYYMLRKQMINLSELTNIEIDTMGRSYDRAKDLICLPEDDSDEIYAGDYFPRRYPDVKLSLEYMSLYKQNSIAKSIGLIAAICDSMEEAELILEKVNSNSDNAFIVNKSLFMGCLH